MTLLRTAMARFTITRANSVYVVVMTAVALFGMLLLWIDSLF